MKFRFIIFNRNLAAVFFGALIFNTPDIAYASAGFQWNVNGLYILYFILAVAAAYYFIKKTGILHKVIANRSKSIEEAVQHAKEDLEKAQMQAEEWKLKMDSLAKEIEELRADFQRQGEIERDKIMKEAFTAGEKIKADMSFRVSQDTKLLAQLCREELIEMALTKASNTLKQKIDDHFYLKLLNEYIDDVEKSN